MWLATILGDGNWPVNGQSAAEQQTALEALIERAAQLGINTLYFQIIARGDALYPSARLPWTPLPLGPGRDPGYDPLQVAIDAAHRAGMELHAWINVFRVGDSATRSLFTGVQNPMHVVNAQPGWVQQVGSELWLDPSVPEARAWMLGNVMEVVNGYDIDAVHFDFARYPQGGLPDDASSFQFDPRGFASIDDWRRNNVTLFVESAFEAVTSVKPWVKLGAAPLGNYQPADAWPGLWAYFDVYQESRGWAENGWVDYLAPQIYFSTGTTPDAGQSIPTPDFTVLVDEWVRKSGGRPIVVGMAPYKAAEGRFPASDLTTQIVTTRAYDGAGHAAFRYDHLMQYESLYREQYGKPALPARSAHRFEAAAPSTPQGFRIVSLQNGAANLAWNSSDGATADPLRAYAIFRRIGAPPDPTAGRDLLAVVDRHVTTFTDIVPSDNEVYYQVAATSRLGMVSMPSPAVSTSMPTAVEATTVGPRWALIESIYPNPSRQTAEVRYAVGSVGKVSVSVVDLLGRVRYRFSDAAHQPGSHQFTLDTSRYAPGVYFFVLEAGDRSVTRAFAVVR